MKPYQLQFIELALRSGALKFGQFTLKSGRISPYFFNAGQLLASGETSHRVGQFYAQRLLQAKLNIDTLFGPAYKGIPLVCATALALARDHQLDYAYCFNRKEVKDHGEGGQIVGAPLSGQVALLDDVITAGTAIAEVMPLIEQAGAKLGAIMIALDREERGQTERSTVNELTERYQVPILSIITFTDLITYLENQQYDSALLQQMRDYRLEYGVSET